MIYVAAPYSDPAAEVVEARMLSFAKVMARMIEDGEYPVSPLMNHYLATAVETSFPRDWAFWQGYSREMMKHCDSMIVLMLPGWETSAGVTAEIEIAKELRLPFRLVGPEWRPIRC